jgi:hypothetical protein
VPDPLQNTLEGRFGGPAHGSISVQEGQPDSPVSIVLIDNSLLDIAWKTRHVLKEKSSHVLLAAVLGSLGRPKEAPERTCAMARVQTFYMKTSFVGGLGCPRHVA